MYRIVKCCLQKLFINRKIWAIFLIAFSLAVIPINGQDSLEALAAHKCSMMIFTHRTKIEEIIHRLKTQYAATAPIAVVFYAGFKEKQSIVNGNLETIESKINQESLPLEHIIFVGDFLTYNSH